MHQITTGDTSRNLLPISVSPFAPDYSLINPSPANIHEREQIARAVSPLHIQRRHTPDRTLTESPVCIDAGPAVPIIVAPRRAQFSLADEQDDDDDSDNDVVQGSSWSSCRDRRPTAANLACAPVNPEVQQPLRSIGSQGVLGSRRPSLHTTKAHAAMQLSPPTKPARVYPHTNRVVSEGIRAPLPLQQALRSSDGSLQSVHAATPHIQRYDPLSSPSQVQLYLPRSVSSGAYRSPALRPSLVRHDKSYDNMKCELGMGGTSEGHRSDVHRGGFRNAIAGMYGRIVSSDHKPHPSDEEQGTRPRMHRATSERSVASTTISDSRKDSDDTMLEEAPTLAYLSQRRKSMAFILGEDDEPKEDDDPRQMGLRRKSAEMRKEYDFIENRRGSYSSEHFDIDFKPRKRTKSLASIVAPLKDFGGPSEKKSKKNRYSNHSSLQSHMAERQKLILKLARALMLFGAPSHRVESQLNALSQVLDVDGQFIHFPGIVIASFGDIDNHTSECHFVKSKTELALGHLNEIHTIYKGVIMDSMTVHEATGELNRLLKAKPEWSILSRVAFNTIRCGIIAPMAFGGSFVDIFVAGAFGGALTFTQLTFAGSNPMFSNVFEITAAIVISLLARVLSVQSVFCYQAVASAGLCLVLPGYIILCGSLELASKNMIAGSVRLVYAIIYSLFIGFGIAIGSDLYFVFDPKARKAIYVPLDTQTQVQGSFTFANETMAHWSGQFTFSNGTKSALNVGSINCERLPEWPWYRQPLDPLFNILFVPLFAFLGCFSLLHPFKSREVPVSVVIACVGYGVNLLANHYIFGRSDVVSAIGSFVIGLLGNVYSRVCNATAFTAMTVAVLFLVPNGLAMAGGLAMTYKGSDGDLYSNGLSIGLRMVSKSRTELKATSGLLTFLFPLQRFKSPSVSPPASLPVPSSST